MQVNDTDYAVIDTH